ncbi:MAG TPA: ribosome assembly RNA-binding protein YhbY [Burkholderiales bacterium]|nr:ribosome assembly RNA-binding protein YhbY [Burkholderiales bacterium]
MLKELTPAERQALKGRAHRLDPVVMIGAEGLTASVLAEVDRALRAHELIKIRVTSDDGDARERLLGEICAATGASPVQHIGKVLVVYRERPVEVVAAPAPPRKDRSHHDPRPVPRPARGASRQAKLRSR